MRKSIPPSANPDPRSTASPARGSSPPPAQPGQEYLEAYYQATSPRNKFTKHKEALDFLSVESTFVFLTSLDSAIGRRNPSSKSAKYVAAARELKARLPNHLDSIFAELNAQTREDILSLKRKFIRSSAQILMGEKFPNTENLKKAINLAKHAAKNVEAKSGSSVYAAAAAADVFAACTSIFPLKKDWAEQHFFALTLRISSKMPTDTLSRFLWKVAETESKDDLLGMLEEMSRCPENGQRINEILSK